MNKVILFAGLVFVCYSSAALATTPGETTRAQAPMPHLTLSAGQPDKMVNVHFTRLDGYVEGKPDNAARLVAMRTEVQQCVRQHQQSGRPINPPRAWPDFVQSARTDRYASANRSIAYQFGLAYALSWTDCSLMEVVSATAMLSSSMGTCHVDLLKKTASGACEPGGHANAPLPPGTRASSPADAAAALKRAPDNPGLVALMRVMGQHAQSGTGQRKTIQGLACEIWKNPLDPEGMLCLSSGGTFTAFDSNGSTPHSGMALEITSVSGIKAHAVEAKLDASVNGAVFAPYLADGFSLTMRKPRR